MTAPGDDVIGQVLVVSGGSGYNELVGATPNAIFVLPVSDDGGSSSEIVRVMGGPSLGDLRSRLIRLAAIAASFPDPASRLSLPNSREALHALLAYRLPIEGPIRDIKQDWLDIIEGRHRLWHGIDPEKRECIRGFLVQFESDVLHRAHRNFNFRGGSIGNFFLAAMQRFFRSIQSAIFLFSALTGIPPGLPECHVLPAINTNKMTTIAASLENGDVLIGQCEISHPSVDSTANAQWSVSSTRRASPEPVDTKTHTLNTSRQELLQERTPTLSNPLGGFDPVGEVPTLEAQSDSDGSDQDEAQSTYESAVLPPQGEPTLGKIAFSKFDSTVSLPSPIQRIFYVNAFRNEVSPVANPAYILGLNRSKMLVYSCGSLWTSIIPCLALRGIATAIAKSPTLKHKVLLLNAAHDRETQGMDALDFVHAICNSLNNVDAEQKAADKHYSIHSLLTHIVYLRQGTIPIPKDKLEQVGIRCIAVDTESQEDPKLGENSALQGM